MKQIFNVNSTKNRITGLVAKAKQLEKLNADFKKFVDQNLATHCFIAKLEDDELTIVIDSAIWATKVRMAIPEILKDLQCQPEFKKIRKINYCVSSKIADFKVAKLNKTPISSENAKLWQETLEFLKNKE